MVSRRGTSAALLGISLKPGRALSELHHCAAVVNCEYQLPVMPGSRDSRICSIVGFIWHLFALLARACKAAQIGQISIRQLADEIRVPSSSALTEAHPLSVGEPWIAPRGRQHIDPEHIFRPQLGSIQCFNFPHHLLWLRMRIAKVRGFEIELCGFSRGRRECRAGGPTLTF